MLEFSFIGFNVVTAAPSVWEIELILEIINPAFTSIFTREIKIFPKNINKIMKKIFYLTIQDFNYTLIKNYIYCSKLFKYTIKSLIS